MKQKVTLPIAVLVLIGAVLSGGWALLSRDSKQVETSAGQEQSTGQKTPADDEETGSRRALDLEGIKIPAKTVNPLKASNYCATAKLLAVYSQQGYGLNKDLGIVDGQKFATRLKVIAGTYARLAQQGSREPKVGAAAPEAWRALAKAADSAEQTLRSTGLQVQSELMITKLATVAEVGREQLPRATATLKRACGISPSVFGL